MRAVCQKISAKCVRDLVEWRSVTILSSLRDWFLYFPQPTVNTVGYFRPSLTGLQQTALAAFEPCWQ